MWFEVGILYSSWVFDSWSLFLRLTGSAEGKKEHSIMKIARERALSDVRHLT